jgi:hypothetical protein
MSKAQTDIRTTSYNAATANPRGYQGTLVQALAEVRAEADEARTYWPLNISRERHELLGFLGVFKPAGAMSGLQAVNPSQRVPRLLPEADPYLDYVEYGAPEAPPEPSFYSLAYAKKHFPQSFKDTSK